MDKGEADNDTYWVTRPEQIRVVSSAVRMAIVDRLSTQAAMSADELARALGMNVTAIYHHLKLLIAAGLVMEAGTKLVENAKRPTTTYRTPSRRMRLIRAFDNPETALMLADCNAATLRQAERDFRRALEGPQSRSKGPQRNHGFFRLVSRAGPDRLSEINAHLEALSELLWADDDPDGEPVALTWTFAPLAESGGGK